MKLFRNRLLSGLVIGLGIVVVAGGGYYLFRYQIWAGYRNWSVGRMNTMAQKFIATNDPRNALLTVRKILSTRPNDPDALKLAVKAAEMNGSTDAIMYQRNLCRVQKTTANNVELMRLALKYEAYSYGIDAIAAVSQDARGLPEYHRLAAEICRKVNRPLAAKFQLISLLSLQPNDNAAKVALAEIEFETSPKALPSDWKARVDALTRLPDVELAATMLQLRAAVARQDAAEAATLGSKLQQRPELSFAQQLRVLEAQWLYDPTLAQNFLVQLQQKVADRPADVVQLVDVLNRHDKNDAVAAWYATLPAATRDDELVKLATAQSLLTLHDWAGLEALLRGAPWKTNEHLRMSLLAYTYRTTGRFKEAAESWKVAVIAAGQEPRRIAALLKSVEMWRWDSERYELLWRLFNLMPTNTAVSQFLVAREYHDGKTANLNKIYARLMEANPSDESARNNFAYTSMLLDTNPGRAQTIARELFQKHPENVSYRTTYTLALHKQGQDREALALIQQLDMVTRQAPVPKLHEAVYAAAVGNIDQASLLLPDLANAELLPEQRQLAGVANLAVARQQTSHAHISDVATVTPSAAASGDGWLAALPNRQAEATTGFKLSDSYLHERNFAKLRQLLKDEKWSQNDHLRYALLTYAAKEDPRGDSTRVPWRQALGVAGRDVARLHDLEVLAKKWSWKEEQMEVSAKIFEREASNTTRLGELLDYYRANARTAEMARVLWLYVDQTNATDSEAAWCVYYSLLCGTNVSPAQTLAVRVYDKAPQNPRHRVAYAFALLHQQRFAEVVNLVQDIDALGVSGMQVSLVEASALLELGRKEEAINILKKFTPVNAVPEEINFAATLFRRAGLPNAVDGVTLR